MIQDRDSYGAEDYIILRYILKVYVNTIACYKIAGVLKI